MNQRMDSRCLSVWWGICEACSVPVGSPVAKSFAGRSGLYCGGSLAVSIQVECTHVSTPSLVLQAKIELRTEKKPECNLYGLENWSLH